MLSHMIERPALFLRDFALRCLLPSAVGFVAVTVPTGGTLTSPNADAPEESRFCASIVRAVGAVILAASLVPPSLGCPVQAWLPASN
jgi:hypothetical protein